MPTGCSVPSRTRFSPTCPSDGPRRTSCCAEAHACNIRGVLTARHAVRHLSPYYYPSGTMIEEGVPCGLLSWERETPQVKTVREDYKRAVAAAFDKEGPEHRPFEVLLENRSGRLTEGRRSHLFFVRAHTIYSAPERLYLLESHAAVQRASQRRICAETKTFDGRTPRGCPAPRS
jgi:hypothetical protein